VGTKRKAKERHAKQEKPDGHLTNNGEIILLQSGKENMQRRVAKHRPLRDSIPHINI